MINYSIQADIGDVKKSLEDLGFESPRIAKKILRKIVSRGKTNLRRAYRASGIKSRDGNLYKAIFGSAKTDNVGYLGILSKQMYKFVPLNYGMHITPKKGRYLRFKMGDKWIKATSVTIPARSFFEEGTRYIGSAEMQADIDVVLAKEVARLMKD